MSCYRATRKSSMDTYCIPAISHHLCGDNFTDFITTLSWYWIKLRELTISCAVEIILRTLW